MYMKCNNGAPCEWTGVLEMTNRFLKQSEKEYFCYKSYIDVESENSGNSKKLVNPKFWALSVPKIRFLSQFLYFFYFKLIILKTARLLL